MRVASGYLYCPECKDTLDEDEIIENFQTYGNEVSKGDETEIDCSCGKTSTVRIRKVEVYLELSKDSPINEGER